ncbi:MAG: gas vesicle protein GvpD [Thermoplasmatales archaeon]|nr:gas vesicle protein GvpD [Thermoplasmatales archaeon]
MEKIRTHVENFDEVLNGGIPAGSVVLVAGTAGTMKSSFAYYVLYSNAKKKKSLYLSLEQDRGNLERQMSGFGMGDERVKIVERKDIGKGLEGIRAVTFMEMFSEYLKNLKNEVNYDILVIDSLPVLEIIAEMKKPRSELFKFFERLRTLNVTSFLITEMSQDSNTYGRYDEDFLADGIIHLKMEAIGDVKVQRRIRCVKMRSSKHSPDWYTLLFDDGKFQVAQVISEA